MSNSWDLRDKVLNTDTDLIFQTLDWHCEDQQNEETGYFEYKIFVFGVSLQSPVTLCIDNFYPYFFIELPINWDYTCIQSVKNAFNNKSIKSFEYLERKRYHGFENNKIRKFVKLSFYSNKAMRSMIYCIRERKYVISGKEYSFPLYESNIDPVLRLTHMRDVLTAGWINIKCGNYSLDETESFYKCSWKAINNYPEFENKLSNTRILYFDIEACSEDGSFPNAMKKNDRITQICCIISDSSGVKKYLFNYGTCDAIEDTVVLQYSSEKKLLMSYSDFIRDTDPDIIVGYNIFGFDNGYLFERAKVLNIEEYFNCQSKLNGKHTIIEKKILNNQQSGFNDWKMTRLIGRTHIDLLQVIKKDFKLESYKLNNVGEHFLKEGKDDVSPKEIFEAWDKTHGSREKRTRVGKYCVQDTMLCLKLFEKFSILTNYIEMAKITRVPLEYLITRGQSIKVFSQIAYETRKAGYLIPVLPKNETEGKFQGATVLDAKVGYYQKPVCGLDFASLYPSIMIAHNMCYSTVVLDDKYLNLPGVEYSTIKCSEDLSFNFVQNQKGVLSGILQSLWTSRKVTKKEMNATADPFIKSVLNAKQLAIKVSMNSIYGFTGASVGVLPCLEISQSVTGCGRQMIEQTSNLAKNQFGCEVIYGDSVTGDTPVLINRGGFHIIQEIQNLFREPEDYPEFKLGEPGLSNKQQYIPTGLTVWTSSGWSKLKRVIRHNCSKKLYRIITPNGIVDVTEDHSLLNKNLEQIKPDQLKIGDRLFHSYPTYINPAFLPTEIKFLRNINTSKERVFKIICKNKSEAARYYLICKFCKLGLSLTYSGGLYTVIINKDDATVNDSVTEIIELPPVSNFVYDLETEDGTFHAGIGEMIVKNTDSCYVIFPEPVNSDGTLKNLFKLAKNAACEISKTFKKPIELEFEKFMWPLILVAKKRYMYAEWTVPDHHNGEIEAKGVELVRRDNCGYVKETLDAVLNPIMFGNDLDEGRRQAETHIDFLLNGMVPINKLVISKNLRSEYKGYTKRFDRNEDGTKSDKYHWERTKEDAITGITYITEECPVMAHVALVEKMRSRDINCDVKPGDRVPFVYVDIGDPKALASKKIEDPKYVIEHNLPIDVLYYLEHQLKNPLKTIFDILLGETECKNLFNRKSLIDAKKRERLSIGDAKRKKENNKDIRKFFNVSAL